MVWSQKIVLHTHEPAFWNMYCSINHLCRELAQLLCQLHVNGLYVDCREMMNVQTFDFDEYVRREKTNGYESE